MAIITNNEVKTLALLYKLEVDIYCQSVNLDVILYQLNTLLLIPQIFKNNISKIVCLPVIVPSALHEL